MSLVPPEPYTYILFIPRLIYTMLISIILKPQLYPYVMVICSAIEELLHERSRPYAAYLENYLIYRLILPFFSSMTNLSQQVWFVYNAIWHFVCIHWKLFFYYDWDHSPIIGMEPFITIYTYWMRIYILSLDLISRNSECHTKLLCLFYS